MYSIVQQRQTLHPVFATKSLIGNRLHLRQTKKTGKMHQRAPGIAVAYFFLGSKDLVLW